MILPEGSVIGKFSGPFEEVLPFVNPLHGAVRVSGGGGEGFVLVDRGTCLAAFYRNDGAEFAGNTALDLIRGIASLECELMRYSTEEMATARAICAERGLLVQTGSTPPSLIASTSRALDLLGEIQKQPGVRAVAAFEEGFTVLSLGQADFEQMGAIAEDLLRAGAGISADLGIGPLEQILLETPKGKLIIAPFRDLFLCVLAEPGSNLGLIRLAIRKVQMEAA